MKVFAFHVAFVFLLCWVTFRYQRCVLCLVVVSPAWLLYPLFGFCIPFPALVFVSLFLFACFVLSFGRGAQKVSFLARKFLQLCWRQPRRGCVGVFSFKGDGFQGRPTGSHAFQRKGGVPYFDRHINPTSMPILLTSFPRG